MAGKKLKVFSADDAGDAYTPTVKTLKGGNAKADAPPEKKPEKMKREKKAEKPAKREAKKPGVQTGKAKPKKAVTKKSPEEKAAVPKFEKPAVPKSEKAPAAKPAMKPSARGEKSPDPSKLKDVARDLIQAKEEPEQADNVIQLVGFNLGNEEFCISIQKVREINRMTDITRVPKTPPFVLGVINLRGKVIPVVNMRARFAFSEQSAGKDSRIIVLELHDRIIGMLVDSVTEVIRLPAGSVEPPPNVASAVETDYIIGVGKLEQRLLILLDIDKVFNTVQIESYVDA